VNAFVKELLSYPRRPEVVIELTKIASENLSGELKLHANVCYLLGRLVERSRSASVRTHLQRIEDECSNELELLSEVSKLARLEAKFSSTRRLTFKKFLKNAFFVDSEYQISTRESELRLLSRSASISLAILNDKQAAIRYVEKLIREPSDDELNRGFHLEYYEDVPRQGSSPLLSTDVQLSDCSKSISALLDSIESAEYSPMTLIQIYTLISLVRHRSIHSYSSRRAGRARSQITKETLSRITKCIQKVKTDGFELGQTMRDLVDRFFREVTHGFENDIFCTMLVDIHNIKEQRRAGWGLEAPLESVGSHSYGAYFLAAMLLPDVSPEEKLLKNDVLRLIAFHDLAESIVSDIPSPQKNAESAAAEEKVAGDIGWLSTIAGSTELINYQATWNTFERETNPAKLHAADIDKLELLIQLYSVKDRPYSIVDRLPDFLSYVEPSKFKTDFGRYYSDRLIKYFEHVQAAKLDVNAVPPSCLWSIAPKMVSIYDPRDRQI
jgi:5'-deoxynucleotidase YfbR-like HD superfamily hydrolase